MEDWLKQARILLGIYTLVIIGKLPLGKKQLDMATIVEYNTKKDKNVLTVGKNNSNYFWKCQFDTFVELLSSHSWLNYLYILSSAYLFFLLIYNANLKSIKRFQIKQEIRRNP